MVSSQCQQPELEGAEAGSDLNDRVPYSAPTTVDRDRYRHPKNRKRSRKGKAR